METKELNYFEKVKKLQEPTKERLVDELNNKLLYVISSKDFSKDDSYIYEDKEGIFGLISSNDLFGNKLDLSDLERRYNVVISFDFMSYKGLDGKRVYSMELSKGGFKDSEFDYFKVKEEHSKSLVPVLANTIIETIQQKLYSKSLNYTNTYDVSLSVMGVYSLKDKQFLEAKKLVEESSDFSFIYKDIYFLDGVAYLKIKIVSKDKKPNKLFRLFEYFILKLNLSTSGVWTFLAFVVTFILMSISIIIGMIVVLVLAFMLFNISYGVLNLILGL